MQKEQRENERKWVRHLRRVGVKAAHPDDGWVDREANTVTFSCPQFNDNPHVGDLIALGRPEDWRLVRVTKVRDGIVGMRYYTFEDTDY